MKVVIGLGNPGLKYKNTRHNLGFQVIDTLAKIEYINFKKRKWNSYIGTGKIESEEVMLAKPRAYMNNSGVAVSAIVNQTNLPLENLLVVCDDFQLRLGKIRIRQKGSSGGHKGLESIIHHLGTDEFPRLRIGIDLPARRSLGEGGPENNDAAKYVLRNFTRIELREIIPAIKRVVSAIQEWLINGIESSMNKFN